MLYTYRETMIYGSPPPEPKPPKPEVGGGKPPAERAVRGPGAYTLGIVSIKEIFEFITLNVRKT